MRHALTLLAAFAILAGFMVSHAFADGIQMLPPVDYATPPGPCAGEHSGLLQWNGTDPIKCVPGTSGDASGNLNVAGTITAQGDITAVGKLQTGEDDTSTCAASNAGQFRFNPKTRLFEGCDGATWRPLMGRSYVVPMATLSTYTPNPTCTEPVFQQGTSNMFYCISACERFCQGLVYPGVPDNGLRFGGGTITEYDAGNHAALCSCF